MPRRTESSDTRTRCDGSGARFRVARRRGCHGPAPLLFLLAIGVSMKTLQLLALVVVALLCFAAPLFAQTTIPTPASSVLSGAAIGAALTIIGAGYGFGKIA